METYLKQISQDTERISLGGVLHTQRHIQDLVRHLMMMMLMVMMNCFDGMVDRQREIISLISIWDNCQRFSPSQISNKPRTGFELAQNVNLDFAKRSFAVVLTTTPRRYKTSRMQYFANIVKEVWPVSYFSRKLHLGCLIRF